MKESEKFLVYYNKNQELIGLREHYFEWEEDDVITTNGVMMVNFGIFRETEKNMSLMKSMFNHICRPLHSQM